MTSGLAHALSVVGDRWTLQIIADLLEGPRRFGELSEALPDIAPNVLAGRLRQLVRDHLVTATPYSRRPLRMSYAVSEAGRDLHGALVLLAAWGARRTGESHATVHNACGTHFEARLYCPTCEQTVDDAQTETLHWA